MSSPKVAIIVYSMYGHIAKLYVFLEAQCSFTHSRSAVAEAEKAGIEKAGGKADIYQYVSMFAIYDFS